MEFLTKDEKNLLRKFAKDEKLFKVVKKVLLASIYNQGVIKKGEEPDERNFAVGMYMDKLGNVFKKTNEELGTELKAVLEGLMHLQIGLKNIEQYGIDEVKEEESKNNAR